VQNPSWNCWPRRAKSKLLVFLKCLCRKCALPCCLISFSPCPFEGKSVVVPLNTIKAYRRSEIIAPPIHNFGVRWKRVVNLRSQPPRKETLVLILRGRMGLRAGLVVLERGKNLFTLVRSEHPILQSSIGIISYLVLCYRSLNVYLALLT